MPRVGRHPLKEKKLVMDAPAHQCITMTTITHIPVLEGYWAESLEVLKLFFDSLFASTELSFDMMVFDNASCPEVQDYLLGLRREGRIQYLTLSTYNLRKLGALDYLLRNAPGEFVAYADSDVYFLPGWLEASLSILETFPEAGKVTALPIVGGDTTEISANVFEKAAADPSIQFETGLLVPELYVRAHQLSLGKTTESYQERLQGRKDTFLTRQGVSALLSGADFQFTITRQAIEICLPLVVQSSDEYFDPIYSPVLERRLATAGYWRLSTPEYLVHHLGNRVPDFPKELPWVDPALFRHFQQIDSERFKPTGINRLDQIVKRNFVRKILKKIYLNLYRLLYESE